MTTIYKLTDQNNCTYNGYKWTPGEWKKTSGEGGPCSKGWLHCYSSPLLAILLNPIHANIPNPKMWEGEGAGLTLDDRGLKQGYTEMRVLVEIPVPVITKTQGVAFGILCAMEVDKNEQFMKWAQGWLCDDDRSPYAAAAYATAASDAAAVYATAATAAYATASSAAAASASSAAAAAYAAAAYAYAAYAAAYAATAGTVNLSELAEKAMRY